MPLRMLIFTLFWAPLPYAGETPPARAYWSRAIGLGVSDDALCYRYSMLAQ